MFSETRKTGLIGEIMAARYLRKKGYDILAANYKSRTGEIDLIAESKSEICFVEVKTRTEGGYFSPATAVDSKKENNVRSTAVSFVSTTKTELPKRFDILEVIICNGGIYKFNHIKNAF